MLLFILCFFFFFQAEDGIRDLTVTGVQTCALPILLMTLPEVAHELRVSESMAKRLIAAGTLPDVRLGRRQLVARADVEALVDRHRRSEEHTSELQSQSNLVCRLLLEKKNNTIKLIV